MNNVKFNTVVETIKTYRSIASDSAMPAAKVLGHSATAARRIHTSYAWSRLARAIGTGGNRQLLMEAAWDDLVTHAKAVSAGYAEAILLLPTVLHVHARPLDIAPFTAQIGDSKTWTPIHSLEALRKALKSEPELIGRLKRTHLWEMQRGEIQFVWKQTPAWLQAEIYHRAISAKFTAVEKKMVTLHKGDKAVVKARSYAAFEALEVENGRGSRIATAGEIILQQALKLAVEYSRAATFWAGLSLPRRPHEDDMDLQSYAGEEDWSYTSPIRTYTAVGTTLGERWAHKCEVFGNMVSDYTSAAKRAEVLLDSIDDVLSLYNAAVTYAWKREDSGEFTPLLNKEVATTYLIERAIERDARRAAETLGVAYTPNVAVRNEVLGAYSDAEQAALQGLLAGLEVEA